MKDGKKPKGKKAGITPNLAHQTVLMESMARSENRRADERRKQQAQKAAAQMMRTNAAKLGKQERPEGLSHKKNKGQTDIYFKVVLTGADGKKLAIMHLSEKALDALPDIPENGGIRITRLHPKPGHG